MKKWIPISVGLAAFALLALFAFVLVDGQLLAKADAAPEEAPAAVVQSARSAVPVQAQAADPFGDSTLATIDLGAGFILDPYFLRVIGGGDVPASEIDEACAGFIDEDPNVVLNWSGESEILTIFVYSDSDPVLVIETPDGEILCSDDLDLVVLDPAITLEDPAEGEYHIHVGSYAADEPALGYLVITELDMTGELADLDLTPLLNRRDYPLAGSLLPDVDLNDLYLRESGIFGHAELSSGFEDLALFAAGGGNLAVYPLDGDENGCQGNVSRVPVYTISWSGGGSLSAYFESEKDSSLMIVTPAGEVVCNDNAAEENLNPVVDILNAAEGDYEIFIGSLVPDQIVTGILTITSDTAAEPAPLSPQS